MEGVEEAKTGMGKGSIGGIGVSQGFSAGKGLGEHGKHRQSLKRYVGRQY